MIKRLDFYFESLAGLGVLLQPDYILQIISAVLTCFSVAVSLAYTLYKWVKAVKKNGKLDDKSVDELLDIVDEHKNKLNGKGGDDNAAG